MELLLTWNHFFLRFYGKRVIDVTFFNILHIITTAHCGFATGYVILFHAGIYGKPAL